MIQIIGILLGGIGMAAVVVVCAIYDMQDALKSVNEEVRQ